MLSSPGRYLALLFLGAALALPLRSEETPAAKQPAPSKTKDADKKSASTPTPPADGKKPSDLKKWDPSTLPADAVVIVCERVADALQMVPNAVILTPAKYLEMRDEIERLRKLLQTDKPVTPTTCQLKGKVEEGAVLLEAVFEGSTDRPNTVVALACPRAGAAPAQNAEGTQIIRRTESGFLAEIEKPGKYQLKLDLFVPLTPRDNGRGFELTLPRATFTRLDLDLPANSKDVRVGGKALSDPDLSGLTLKGHHLSGTPSTRPVEKLDVAWKEVRPPSGIPVLTADGRIQVRLDPSGLTTEADLVLRIEGAPTNVWRLLVPVGAEVQVTPSDDARARTTTIETDKQKYKFAWLRTIHLKEPSAEPLQVHIKAHAPPPRGGSVVPVGPFFVLGAARQTGTVEVKNQVRHLHLYYHGHGDMTLRQVDEGTGGDTTAEVAKFTYGDIPKVENPKDPTGASSLSWLDLEVETVRAQVRTRVIHTLTLRLDSTHESLHWDILTTITPVSKWPDIEQLKVLVPPNWVSTDDGIPVTGDKNARFVTYRSSVLPRDGSAQKLQGRYDLSCQAKGSATLRLPRPLGFIEQCKVEIKAPADSEVLLLNAAQADLELLQQPRPNEQTWHCRQVLPPAWPGVDVSWRPYRPDLPATSVVDLTLNGKHADIRHEIRLQLPQTPPASFSLRLPAALGDTLPQIEPEEKLQPWHDASATPKGIVRFSVPASAGGTECRLVLNYTIPLGGDEGKPPGPGQRFTVPLVVPEQTRGAIKVRVWSGLSSLPLPVSGSAWEERSIEEVKERQDLPVLVLQAPQSDAPLVLRCGEPSSVFTALVERALVRVQLREDGEQIYRASFLLRQLADQHLDIKLPGSVATLKVHIALNHHSVMPADILNEQGQSAPGGDIARLSLGPDLIRRLALLEVSYQLSGRGGGRLRSTLQPPQLRGAPPTVPTRWLVTLPSHRVLIAPENAAGLEHTWTRRGWLLAARLNRTGADIEREFEEPLPAELHQGERSESEALTVPTLVCWQDSVEPLTLTHAPQQAWLLVCSLGLLVLGLGLYWTARPRPGEGGHMAPWLWPILALLTLGVVVGALFWPTILWAVVYGCEPGALVLACVIAFQWLMHQRYRRQIVFLPSFSRGRSGSSLLRKSASSRPRTGEPSTVDAPPPSVG